MTLVPSNITSMKKLRRLRRWFKRNVLRQPWMLEGFASPFVHEPMLLDKIRGDAYREAIQRTVKPDDVVVDLGFLKPGGRIVPESADTFLLPISSEAFGLGQLPPRFYDLDYRPLIKRLSAEYRHLRASGKPFLALSEPALCYHVDFRKDTQNPGKTFAPFRVIAEGRLDGFLGWFEARLCEGVTLSNSPYLPLTSWWQLYLPVAEQPHYRAGQTMLLYLDPKITDGEAEWSYSVQPATPECSASVSQK